MELHPSEGEIDVKNARVILPTTPGLRLSRIGDTQNDRPLNIPCIEEIARNCTDDQYHQNNSRRTICHRFFTIEPALVPTRSAPQSALIPSITRNYSIGLHSKTRVESNPQALRTMVPSPSLVGPIRQLSRAGCAIIWACDRRAIQAARLEFLLPRRSLVRVDATFKRRPELLHR